MNRLKNDFIIIKNKMNELDKKVIIIFLSFAVLQTVSWYFSSRKFFILNIYPVYFIDNVYSDLFEFLYWFFADFTVYGVFTILIIKIILKERLIDYGYSFGDSKIGLFYSIIFILFMLPLLWLVSSLPDFVLKYPHLSLAKASWGIFIYYEIGMMFYLYAWEFVFRGFLLFGLYPKFGYYSILIQMIPFVILHNGKPVLETFSAILGGIALGILALKTRSFLYGFFVHFSIMFGIDLLSVLRFNSNSYGIGIKSFLKLFGY